MTQHLYQCEDCGYIFDDHGDDREGQGEVKCPQCGGEGLRDVSPTFNARTPDRICWPRGGG